MMIYKRTDELFQTSTFIDAGNPKLKAAEMYTEVPESAPLPIFPINENNLHSLLTETEP